jgi:phenylalanine-4-hydroxylase
MNATIESNPLLDRLPKHLKQFIKPQDYSDYTYQSGSLALRDA